MVRLVHRVLCWLRAWWALLTGRRTHTVIRVPVDVRSEP